MTGGLPSEGYPPGPVVSLERMGEPDRFTTLAAQLAANLMPLCGVPNPDKGDGVTRLLSLSEINLSTISQGSPSSIKVSQLVEGSHVIRNASLQRFGPLTVTACVLTGANYLLEPLAQAHEKALEQPIFDGLSLRMRVGMTACWAFQTFREQPGLFMLGGQAWRMQRTLMHDAIKPTPEPEPTKYSPPYPDTLAPLKKLRGLGDDVFFDLCRDASRKRGALSMATDVAGHAVPKVSVHPGDFTERFLRTVGLLPGPLERLSWPLVPDSSDMAVLTAAWAANDLTARTPAENELTPACQEANEVILSQIRQAGGLRIDL